MKHVVRAVVFSSAFALVFAWAPIVVAHEGHDHGTETAEAVRTEVKERAETRLDAAKKRVCENRSKNIEAIMQRSVTRAENHTALFTNIAEKVKAFYARKGKTVANYDELVAAVESAKAGAASDIAAMKAAADFSCDSDDPKGEVEAYQAAHKQTLQGLKEFRTSVKNLIVGVRSAQGGTQ